MVSVVEKGKGLSRTVELAAPLDVAELQLELDVLLEQLVIVLLRQALFPTEHSRNPVIPSAIVCFGPYETMILAQDVGVGLRISPKWRLPAFRAADTVMKDIVVNELLVPGVGV